MPITIPLAFITAPIFFVARNTKLIAQNLSYQYDFYNNQYDDYNKVLKYINDGKTYEQVPNDELWNQALRDASNDLLLSKGKRLVVVNPRRTKKY